MGLLTSICSAILPLAYELLVLPACTLWDKTFLCATGAGMSIFWTRKKRIGVFIELFGGWWSSCSCSIQHQQDPGETWLKLKENIRGEKKLRWYVCSNSWCILCGSGKKGQSPKVWDWSIYHGTSGLFLQSAPWAVYVLAVWRRKGGGLEVSWILGRDQSKDFYQECNGNSVTSCWT